MVDEIISMVSNFALGYTWLGVNVSYGDVTGQGIAEILAGSGPGESHDPVIKAFSWDVSMLTLIHGFTAYPDSEVTHEVNVTAGSSDY